MDHISFRHYKPMELINGKEEKEWVGLAKISEDSNGPFTQPIILFFRQNPNVIQVVATCTDGLYEFVRDDG